MPYLPCGALRDFSEGSISVIRGESCTKAIFSPQNSRLVFMMLPDRFSYVCMQSVARRRMTQFAARVPMVTRFLRPRSFAFCVASRATCKRKSRLPAPRQMLPQVSVALCVFWVILAEHILLPQSSRECHYLFFCLRNPVSVKQTRALYLFFGLALQNTLHRRARPFCLFRHSLGSGGSMNHEEPNRRS